MNLRDLVRLTQLSIYAVVMSLILATWPGMAAAAELPQRQLDLPGVSVRFPDHSERHLTIPELESLGVWRVQDRSGAGNPVAVLEGPLLRDVLAHVGAGSARSILVRAADAYAQDIPQDDWRDLPVILATRMNGRPLGRHLMGPTQIIYPVKSANTSGESGSMGHDVRLITLIEIEGP